MHQLLSKLYLGLKTVCSNPHFLIINDMCEAHVQEVVAWESASSALDLGVSRGEWESSINHNRLG